MIANTGISLAETGRKEAEIDRYSSSSKVSKVISHSAQSDVNN